MRILVTIGLVFALGCTAARGSKKSNLLAGDSAAADGTAGDAAASGDATDGVPIDGSDVADGDDGSSPDADVVASDDGADIPIIEPDDVPEIAPDVPIDNDTGPKPVGVQGNILVIQVESSQQNSAAVTASFVTSPAPGLPPLLSEGGCDVFAQAGPATPPKIPSLDAGTITLTGLQQPVILTPTPIEGGLVRYDSNLSPSATSILMFGGLTVGATAAGGGDLPGVSLEVAVPAAVQALKPSQEDKLDANSDLQVSWVAATASLIQLDLFVYDIEDGKAANGSVIVCKLAGDPGAAVIPKALLKKLPDLGAGLFGANGILIVGVTRVITATAPLSDGNVALGISRSGGTGAAFDP